MEVGKNPKRKSTPAGFEPALPKEMPEPLVAGHRVNHSAKVSSLIDEKYALFSYINLLKY